VLKEACTRRGAAIQITVESSRRDSAQFQQACSGIEHAVREAFSAARSHAEHLEEHRPLHDFAAAWSPERYAAQSRCVVHASCSGF